MHKTVLVEKKPGVVASNGFVPASSDPKQRTRLGSEDAVKPPIAGARVLPLEGPGAFTL